MKNWKKLQNYKGGIECCLTCSYACFVIPGDKWYCTFPMSEEERELPCDLYEKDYEIDPDGKCKAYERDQE